MVKDYRVEFLPEVSDELTSLDKAVAQRILKKLKGLFKLRVGSYRVFYSFDREERIITVHLIGHRREIYKPS